MGLFSFIGKAAKAVGGLIGGPVGGVLKVGGSLLDHKAQGAVSGIKYPTISTLGTNAARGKPPTFTPQVCRPGGSIYGNATQAMPTPRTVLSSTPVLPGGAFATPSGPIGATSSTPPAHYGGAGARRPTKRRRATKKKSTRKKSRLKFGSPAWRKKYMKKRR